MNVGKNMKMKITDKEYAYQLAKKLNIAPCYIKDFAEMFLKGMEYANRKKDKND